MEKTERLTQYKLEDFAFKLQENAWKLYKLLDDDRVESMYSKDKILDWKSNLNDIAFGNDIFDWVEGFLHPRLRPLAQAKLNQKQAEIEK
jgi:hypothetical protein